MRAALVGLLRLAAALRVSFEIEGAAQLSALQDFGARGGTASTDLTVSKRSGCNSTECVWDDVRELYLVLLSSDQLRDATPITARNDENGFDPEREGCGQPSMARTAISLLRWREARQRSSDGTRALLIPGGDELASVVTEAAEMPPYLANQSQISFRILYRLPMREDLYTMCVCGHPHPRLRIATPVCLSPASHGPGAKQLTSHSHLPISAVLNCAEAHIKLEGEITFEGLDGEKLSLTQVDLIWARTVIAVLTFVVTLALVVLCAVHRQVTVPLQWLLVFATAARVLHQLLLMVPLVAAAQGELIARALSSDVVESWAAGCSSEVSCGVFVLSFQVMRILLIFAIVLFINASVDRLRREHNHQWDQLFPELLRLTCLLAIRRRLIMVYLILPIIFMYIEVQVLGWEALWFKQLWREILELYLIFSVSSRVLPSSLTCVLSNSPYAMFFRYILGSHLDSERADAFLAGDRRLMLASGDTPLHFRNRDT